MINSPIKARSVVDDMEIDGILEKLSNLEEEVKNIQEVDIAKLKF